jgi:hypothetical protein
MFSLDNGADGGPQLLFAPFMGCNRSAIVYQTGAFYYGNRRLGERKKKITSERWILPDKLHNETGGSREARVTNIEYVVHY